MPRQPGSVGPSPESYMPGGLRKMEETTLAVDVMAEDSKDNSQYTILEIGHYGLYIEVIV